MSTGTITDREGHMWPVSGLWCEHCGMPLHQIDEATAAHPSCRTVAPLTRPEMARLVDAVTDLLNATIVEAA